MIHLYTGNDAELLKQEALKEISKNCEGELNDFNFGDFDMYNDLIQDAISACETMSFTTEKKFVIVYNNYFLSSTVNKAPANWTKKQDLDVLDNYVKHENPNCDLYLLVPGKLLADRSSKLIKSLKSKAKFISLSDLKTADLMALGMSYVGERKADIDRESLFEVISRTGEDYLSLTHALDKLLCYSDNIRMDAVNALIFPKLEDNVFSIIENLFKSNVKSSIKGYRDLTSSGYSVISLLPVFASQLRFMYKVAFLLSVGENEIEISKALKCNPYRVRITRSIAGKYSNKAILDIMADLGEIENHIKFDGDNPDILFEVFMVNFRRKYLLRKGI